jgi:hypothetical protein
MDWTDLCRLEAAGLTNPSTGVERLASMAKVGFRLELIASGR